jgi:hypothetical protein
MFDETFITVGIIAEGPTDHTVIEDVLATRLDPGLELRALPIQPDSSDAFGDFGPHGGGWKGVRSWCEETAALAGGLTGYLSAAYGPAVDVLLVHVDADIAGDAEIDVEQPCPPASATTDAVRKVLLGWLGFAETPPRLVLVVPSKSIEAWVLAALAAENSKSVPGIECIMDPARHLTRRPFNFLRTKDGTPKKNQDVYRDILGPETAARWGKVSALCLEARRLSDDFAAAVAAALEKA